MKRLLLVIPAFNEAEMIGRVIKSLPRKIRNGINIDCLVVNDGSTDATEIIVKKLRIKIINHTINRGLGAALATGFEYAKIYNYDYLITFDADGQHRPEDILKIANPLIDGIADVVIGSRFIDHNNMPILRKYINYLSNVLTFILFRIWTTDSQSGIRGFTSKVFKNLILKSQRMEISTEIFKEVKRLDVRLVEVPVQVVYTDYSLRKGQKLSNAPNVVWKLILHRFI